MSGHEHSSTVLGQHSLDDGEDVDNNNETNEDIDAVVVTQKTKQPEYGRVTEKKSSWAWEYIHVLKDGPLTRRRNARGNKDVGNLCGYVCTVCLKNGVPFRDSLISLHNNGISNGVSHLLLVHKMKNVGDEQVSASLQDLPHGHGRMEKFLTVSNNSHLQRVHALVA